MAKTVRGNNEGSIYQRPDGSWRAQVTLNGRRLSFSGRTCREVQEWVRDTLNEIEDGLTYDSTQIILDNFLRQWLESAKASMRPRTWEHYEKLAGKHVLPALG